MTVNYSPDNSWGHLCHAGVLDQQPSGYQSSSLHTEGVLFKNIQTGEEEYIIQMKKQLESYLTAVLNLYGNKISPFHKL